MIFQVKRAIIMAAGVGSRMNPITFSIPKPLIKVNGKAMIDTIIEGLYQNDITEIYVVVGYLKEQFEEWVKKYQNVTLIENPYYLACNNISSLYVAREHLKDVIILDGDQIIYNPNILKKKFTRSGYSCVWTDEVTKEWLLSEKNGVVSSCSRTGGKHGWQLYSISRWTEKDGQRLKKHLEYEFEIKKNRQIYWDDIAIFCYPQEYQLGIQEIKKSDLLEIDSLQELIKIDSSYSHCLL